MQSPSQIPTDRHVVSLVVGGEKGEHGGVVIKWALDGGAIEAIWALGRATYDLFNDLNSFEAHRGAMKRGPRAERRFRSALPPFGPLDYVRSGNAEIATKCQTQPAEQAIDLKFDMRDGSTRQYQLSRFVVEQLRAALWLHRECWAQFAQTLH